MSYWQTVKEWNTLWYTVFWVVIVFPGYQIINDFGRTVHRGDYSGAAGVLVAALIWFVVFYLIIGTVRYIYKSYTMK
jgi:threonine/homoserine efflux transporter RhtA